MAQAGNFEFRCCMDTIHSTLCPLNLCTNVNNIIEVKAEVAIGLAIGYACLFSLHATSGTTAGLVHACIIIYVYLK